MIKINDIPQTSMDLIRLIILDQIDIAPERVNIYGEKWIIPPGDDLFVTIEYVNGRCIANRNTFISTGGDPIEKQDLNMMENITVGVFSKNRSAAQRKEEIIMAMMSLYSQSLQEKYAFKIARNAPIQDLSFIEGSAMLKRYDINLVVFAWYQKIVSPNYIISPISLKVIANDVGSGTMTRQLNQFTELPN